MLETRVENLIQDYMDHYEVSFDKAVEIMIEDLRSAEDLEDH